VYTPRIASSVVLTLFDTALIYLSTKLFIRLDLPALGAPSKQTYKERAPWGLSLHERVS